MNLASLPLFARSLDMQCGDACPALWQFVCRSRAECSNDDPFVLDRFGIIDGRFFEGLMFTAFDTNDLGVRTGKGNLHLIGCERFVPGVHKDIEGAEVVIRREECLLLGGCIGERQI